MTTAYSQGTGFIETACVIGRGKNKGYLNIWGMSRCYWGECTALARAKVLGMSHLHKDEVQLVLDTTL